MGKSPNPLSHPPWPRFSFALPSSRLSELSEGLEQAVYIPPCGVYTTAVGVKGIEGIKNLRKSPCTGTRVRALSFGKSYMYIFNFLPISGIFLLKFSVLNKVDKLN